MNEFFSKCGEFLGHRIEIYGTAPNRTHEVVFEYEHGTASYDGRSWMYSYH